MKCPECENYNVVKRGKRCNQSGTKQRYLCNDCDITFIEHDGFERMRHKPEAIVRAVHQHADGFSLYQASYHLEQHDNVKVTLMSIWNWTKKYVLVSYYQ